MRAILRFGFEKMGLHSVEAKLHPDNRASRRVLEKLGFVKEGHLAESYFNAHLDVFEDTAIYSLLRRDHR
jgi:ribosomal-protein-alanine N-acetyltransferase